MTIPEILYPQGQSPHSAPAASLDVAVTIVAGGEEASLTPSTAEKKARTRVAKALLEKAPTLTQTSPQNLSQITSVLKEILNTAPTRSDIPASVVDEIRSVLDQIGALDLTEESDPDTLQKAIATLFTHLSQIQLPEGAEELSEAEEVVNDTFAQEAAASNNQTVSNPANPEDPSNGRDLVAFMTFVLLKSIESMNYEAANSKTTAGISEAFVKFTKEVLDKVTKDIQAYAKAVEAEKHKSGIAKILSYVVSGLMVVIGALTGQPELAVAGLIMLTMNASGGQEKLNQELNKLPLVGRIFAEIGIAVIQAAAGSLANLGVKALTTATAEGASLGAGFTLTGTQVVQQLGSGQFYSDCVMLVLNFTNTGKDKKELVAGIAGAVLSVIGSMGATVLDCRSALQAAALAQGAQGAVKTQFGEKLAALMEKMDGKWFTRIKTTLQLAKGGLMIGASAYNIEASRYMFKEADIIMNRAVDESTMTILNYVQDVVQSVSQSIQQGINAKATMDREVAGRMEQIVNPWPV